MRQTIARACPGDLGKGKRSEEHTSELQSQSNIVCRLLLEKKNTGSVSSSRGRRRCLVRVSRDPSYGEHTYQLQSQSNHACHLLLATEINSNFVSGCAYIDV